MARLKGISLMETVIASAIINGAICCILMTTTNAFKMGFHQVDNNIHAMVYQSILANTSIPKLPEGYTMKKEVVPLNGLPIAGITISIMDHQGHPKYSFKKLRPLED